jgi:RNA polymerase sigma factor (sigma-70 family)
MDEAQNLLRQYSDTGSEHAFAEVVRRHIDLVYSVARRVGNGDAHFAEDVAQIVFADVARRSRELSGNRVFAGWLYRHTWFTAAKAIRSEQRRKTREEAAMQHFSNQDAPQTSAFSHCSEEALYAVLNELGPKDRTALVLRFLEKRDLRSVGAALGVADDAAQKRVTRALEKVRLILARKGMPATAAEITAALGLLILSTPDALSAKIIRGALAGKMAGGVLSTFTEYMSTTKMKILSAAAGCALIGTPVVLQHRALERARRDETSLRQEISALTRQHEETLALLRKSSVDESEFRRQQAELLRLRAEVTRLHKKEEEEARLAKKQQSSGIEEAVNEQPVPQITIQSRVAHIPVEAFKDFQAFGFPPALSAGAIFKSTLASEKASELLEQLQNKPGVDLLTAPKITTLNKHEARVSVTDTVRVGGSDLEVGQKIDILPTIDRLEPGVAMLSADIQITDTQLLSDPEAAQAPVEAGAPSGEFPRFRTRSLEAHASLANRETYVMATPYWVKDKGPVVLMFLITPLLVTETGNAWMPKQ